MTQEKNIECCTAKNFVIIGETGSGKTELALNLAQLLQKCCEKQITVFDMDTTKSMFRLRDAADKLSGVDFCRQNQFMDTPVVPPGVKSALEDLNRYVIMDVGGDKQGAVCLGQYEEFLKSDSTYIFYVINPYRCFSDTPERIRSTMRGIFSCSRIQDDIHIVCNPYCGEEQNVQTIRQGAAKLNETLAVLNLRYEVVMLPRALWSELAQEFDNCVCINRYLTTVPGVPS